MNRRITKNKLSAILYNNIYTAENFHIYKSKITAIWNNQCLYWTTIYSITKFSISSTCMRTVPCLNILWYRNCFVLSAKRSNCPWLHIIHILSIRCLLTILKFKLLCKYFCTSINFKIQLITCCSTTALIRYCYTNWIRAGF